jgi:hypothetical protein
MSWQATAWAERQATGHPSRKALLLVMANYADENGYCWPSQETLAAGAEMSLDTVQRQSKRLHAMELIKVGRLPKKRGQWQGFCYTLNLSKETRPPKPARPQNAVWPARPFVSSANSAPPDKPANLQDKTAADCSGPRNVDRNLVSPVGCETSAPPTGNPYGVVRPGQAATMRPSQAAPSPATGPQSLRPKPSGSLQFEYSSENRQHQQSAQTRRSPPADRLKAFQGKQEPEEVIQHRIAQRLGSEGWLILQAMSYAKLCRLATLERRGELDDETLVQAALSTRLAQPP